MSKIAGLDKLNRRLKRIPATTKAALQTTLQQEGARLMTLQKALAPVDEGDLRDSVRMQPGPHDLAINILAGGARTTRPVRQGATSPSFDYAAEAERSSPFFYSSYRALKKSIRSRIARAVGKAAGGDAK